MKNIAGRLTTETCYIRDLIQDIAKGEIKIPKFQRPFVWSPKQALDLLDSIAHNYPIGSILIWKTHDKLIAERNIGEFQLPTTDELTPTNYVLDGQQRLTVIYSYLGAKVSDSGIDAAYDLEREQFIEFSGDEQIQIHMFGGIFPLRHLFDTTKLLNFRSRLLSHPNSKEYQQKIDSLYEVLSNYKIPIVTLKELTVEEVCPIFERINSSGTQLSTYDLMVAATWSQRFDLNDKTSAIIDALSAKGFDDLKGENIIKCLTAVTSASVYQDDILKLRNLSVVEMEDIVLRVKNTLSRTIDLLTTEFKVYSLSLLPYEAILVILCAVLEKLEKPNAQQLNRIREWFWRVSFTERYRGASETIISNDIKDTKSYILDNVGSASNFGDPPDASVICKAIFRTNNARSKAFALLLASQNPRNLTDGSLIDLTEALSLFNRRQYHHIYPKNYLKSKSLPSKIDSSSIANICMLTASANREIGDRSPNEYIPEIIEDLAGNAERVFAANLLPNPLEVDYKILDYVSFLKKRSVLIQDCISDLCHGRT
jgi:hypothetical protein